MLEAWRAVGMWCWLAGASARSNRDAGSDSLCMWAEILLPVHHQMDSNLGLAQGFQRNLRLCNVE